MTHVIAMSASEEAYLEEKKIASSMLKYKQKLTKQKNQYHVNFYLSD